MLLAALEILLAKQLANDSMVKYGDISLVKYNYKLAARCIT